MSITFFTETADTQWMVSCSCGDATSGVALPYKEAYASLSTSAVACGDEYCGAFCRRLVEVNPLPSLNLSNINARGLFDLLGVTDTDEKYDRNCGRMPAEEMLGRILIAEGLSMGDPGMPATQEGNLVNCGREAGYYDVRLRALAEVAEAASQVGAPVMWS